MAPVGKAAPALGTAPDGAAAFALTAAVAAAATLDGDRLDLPAAFQPATAVDARAAVVQHATVGAPAAVGTIGEPRRGRRHRPQRYGCPGRAARSPCILYAMDNLAHALVGAALGRAVADPKVARSALLGAVAANAPDWTELFIGLPGDRAVYLVRHRGITHSLVGALVETLALTLLVGIGARWWTRRRGGTAPPWGWLAACIGAAVLSHLYMDWQGSYGLRPFLPWDGTWYYGDWVAIVDPFFWLIPLVALAWGTERHWTPLAAALVVGGAMTAVVVRAAAFVAPWVLAAYAALCVVAGIGWVQYWLGPVARRRAAALALLVLALYAGAQGVVAQLTKPAVRREAERRFGPEARWAALTRPGWPFTWERVYAGADTVAGDDWSLPRQLAAPPVAQALRETPEGRAMGQFARFLAAEVDSTGVGVTVYLRDVRYARDERAGWGVVGVRMGGGR